jgi:hypothetical protein
MTPDELSRAAWDYLGTVGIQRDPPNTPRLLVQGVNGASEYTVGLLVNGQAVMRLDGETVDDLTARVRRNLTLRGDPDNEAVTLYNPHVAPKPIRTIRFGRRRW